MRNLLVADRLVHIMSHDIVRFLATPAVALRTRVENGPPRPPVATSNACSESPRFEFPYIRWTDAAAAAVPNASMIVSSGCEMANI
jgi:hypothetical protein